MFIIVYLVGGEFANLVTKKKGEPLFMALQGRISPEAQGFI